MKMSRSIKDYKDAMDSIRISESFYKRTETLLNELPEAEIEKRPFYMSKKITAGIMAAAACVICVIGVRTVIDIRQDNIGSVTETGLTEISLETTEVSVPELIDMFEDEDSIDEMLIEDDIDIPAENEETEEGSPDSSKPMTIDIGGGIAVATTPDERDPAPEASPEAGNTITTGNSTEGNPGVSGKSENVSDDSKAPMLNDLSLQQITVEITPYFDMDEIVSGESSLKLNGTDCQELIEYISELSGTSYEIPNSSFKSLFSLSIADEEIGTTFYSIYVTNQNTMIITRHNPDSQQQRVSYGLTGSEFKELKHMLFLMFGTESDYELFENLISGK